MYRNRRTHRQGRGVAVTELAVCMPLLVVFLLGTIEMCSIIHLKHSVSIAAYEGARVALIHGSTETNVRTRCEQLLTERNVSGAAILVAPTGYEASPAGTFVAVEVSAPYATNGMLPITMFAEPYTTARVEMMKEF